ncbi:hypothetical protein [Providencia stuartii]|uniref:hypothetical protein n=1 Tax=Providencia stuartii TaxID=588 RepID=UPI001F3DE890|nr:hypothetical protein [Providencia stuartii]
MKFVKTILATTIVASCATGVANAAIDQGSGVINFTGKVINAPCSLPGDGTVRTYPKRNCQII